ncbi:major facilitator superfamily domain-containing protein [Mycena galericulata]|nr:major facilitator superfamily domain-containing protein [Mycena galericulata]
MATTSIDSEPTMNAAQCERGDAIGPPTMESTVLSGRRLAIVFVAMSVSTLQFYYRHHQLRVLKAFIDSIGCLGPDNFGQVENSRYVYIFSSYSPSATALPRITSDFDSFSLQGWVATAFPLAQSVFLLFVGQLLRIFAAKWVLVSAIAIFETGSLVCGVSQNVNQLIAGRAVSGLGAAGIFVSIIQVLSQATRLEDRPRLMGLFGVVFGLSSIIGPLIGGGLTDHASPLTSHPIPKFNREAGNLGAVSITTVMFLLKAAPPMGSDPNKRSWEDLMRQVRQMDLIGAILVAGAVTILVMALQWAGNTKPWNDKAIIICFVLAGVLAGAFIYLRIAIFHSKSIYAVVIYCFLTRFSLLLFTYYTPIYYQAVKHHSATQSGLDLLPFMISVVLTGISSGQIIGVVGYYWPFLFCAPILLAVGSRLLYTILVGVATGMGMQDALLAVQVEFKDEPKLLAQATSVASFAQFLGGTIGLGVAEPAPAAIVKESPTAIHGALPAAMIPGVVQAYMQSLRIVFVVGVPVAGLALMAAMIIQNIRIEKTAPVTTAPRSGDEEKGAEGNEQGGA